MSKNPVQKNSSKDGAEIDQPLEVLIRDGEEPDERRDYLLLVTMPERVQKCCDKLNESLSNQGWKRYCSQAKPHPAPYHSIGIKVNTYKVVVECLVRLPYIIEGYPLP